jgi:hypothetical protein
MFVDRQGESTPEVPSGDHFAGQRPANWELWDLRQTNGGANLAALLTKCRYLGTLSHDLSGRGEVSHTFNHIPNASVVPTQSGLPQHNNGNAGLVEELRSQVLLQRLSRFGNELLRDH